MRVLDFIFASRPMLHIPIWTVYLVTLHYHLQMSGGSFRWSDLIVITCISLFFTGAAYLNQVYDYESDQINRKVGFLQRGIISNRQMIAGFVIACIVPLSVAPFFSWILLVVFTQFLVLAYVYSAPPLRLKDRPFWGLFANSYGHGFLVAVSAVPGVAFDTNNVRDWGCPLYFLFAVGGTYLLTTIPDRFGDEAAGKRTLAVVWGRTGALVLAMMLIACSAVVAYLSGRPLLVYLSMAAVLMILNCLLFRVDWPVLLAAKTPLLLLTLLAGHFYPGYLVFIVALIIVTRIYYYKRFNLIYPKLI